ncbi:hairy and enhancer of split 5, gene 2 S homeolog [Xenopus laevis]|uniref:Transcription factor HES-5 n=2 Tax=Xenopus laevis TaxID=8355 RepID=Q53U32_XENLA|nr:hairy and enhancer of split 5, gene 2 S homeolog [Xenopus laevis]OCT70560.1 hypothetical protein XELAEV_18037484mg [Xenopus laevis]BAD95801.1 enhancer of split related protein 3/7b [Xenopus laevis]
MAPSTAFLKQQNISPKKKNKLRKPVVEKMRRDRINSSIEQLKVLLENVFHQQEPNVKLEKADILEMTVTYLRQQTLRLKGEIPHNNNIQMEYKDGYSRCFEEVIDFLSLHQKQPEAEAKLISHFHSNAAASSMSSFPMRYNQSKPENNIGNSSSLWRPW